MQSKSKILFIAPDYHGYGKMICEMLKERNFEVHWINQSIGEVNLVYGYMYKYMSRFDDKIAQLYYSKYIESLPQDIDIVLIIKAQTLTESVLEKLKEMYSKSRFIMYHWDSVQNENNALRFEKYFDKILTFDTEDAKRYGWVYRPLFYNESYINGADREIDLSMVATIHTERVRIMHQMKKMCTERDYTFYGFLQCTRLGFYKRKYITKDPAYTLAERSEVTFCEMPIIGAYEIYNKSRVVVDYTNPEQTGFTMRTIESIGTGCKLITNNKKVAEADFFDSNNIFIYDTDINEVPDEFVRTSYVDNKRVLKKYTLKSWIEEVLA